MTAARLRAELSGIQGIGKEDLQLTDADERRVGKALQGLEFPASRDDIIAFASERGAHEKTLRALYALPRRSYSDTDDVEQAVPQRPEQAR